MLARSKEKNEVLTKQVNLMPKSCKQENKSKILEGIVRSEVGKDMHHWERISKVSRCMLYIDGERSNLKPHVLPVAEKWLAVRNIAA